MQPNFKSGGPDSNLLGLHFSMWAGTAESLLQSAARLDAVITDPGTAIGASVMPARSAKTGEYRYANGAAVIQLLGTLTPKRSLLTELLGGTALSDASRQLKTALADPDIERIVIEIDSAGGPNYGVLEFANQVLAARHAKPITAAINGVAGGSAYWIAAAASEIAITRGGEAGGIGIVAIHEDHSRALDAAGVRVSLVSAGKYKTEGNPYEPLADPARRFLQQRVDEVYGQFVNTVARGRGVGPLLVRQSFGQGRLVSAPDAVHQGLADRIANLDQVLAARTDRAHTLVAGRGAEDSRRVSTDPLN